MKKTILTMVLSCSLLGCFMGCFCPDSIPFWNITTTQLQVFNYQNSQLASIATTQVNTDTLGFKIDFGAEFLAYEALHNPFISAAYASSCPVNGHKGMKDEISTINIHSNVDFNAYSAGQSLNPITRTYGISLNEWLARKFFNSLILYELDEPFIDLWLTERPTNNTTHNFTFTITFQSGRVEQVQTGPIDWI